MQAQDRRKKVRKTNRRRNRNRCVLKGMGERKLAIGKEGVYLGGLKRERREKLRRKRERHEEKVFVDRNRHREGVRKKRGVDGAELTGHGQAGRNKKQDERKSKG